MSKDEMFGLYTTQTSRNMIRFLTARLKAYDVTPEQWTVLKQLNNHSGISQKELAQIADKDQATVTRILDILERKKLIYKETNKEDRRSFLLHITEKGRKTTDEIYPFMEGLFEDILLHGISKEQLTIFRQVLLQINENITRHDKK